MTSDLDLDPVRRALTITADGVRPPADLTDRVRRGGRRRVRRRRAALAGTLAVLLAGGTAGVVQLARPPASAQLGGVAELLLDQPTRGDLADDRRWLSTVLATYRRTRDDSPLRGLGLTRRPAGEPHVTWAGSTPAGPAAAVVQRMWTDRHQPSVFIWFAGTDPAGRVEPVGADILAAPGRPAGWGSRAFLTGVDRSTLVVLDVGGDVQWSARRTYRADRVVRTDWRPVTFTDGAAVVRVPPQRDRYAVAVRDGAGAYLSLGNLTDPTVIPDDPGLGWRTPAGGGWPADRPARFPLAPRGALSLDTVLMFLGKGDAGQHEPAGGATGRDWTAYGRTGRGELFVAADVRFGGDPTRTVVYIQPLTSTDPRFGPVVTVYGDEVDRTAPLPVAVRLPDGRGWLVARKDATLSYLDHDGRWHPAGRNAALLPSTATRVRVDTTEVAL
ncbi:hypothetical protein [Micromonospora mirobrigensis]|uniref:Uncharacterized protein n=1 Tax=Micromonospora mirobrigensis TaxID=262898 RepID=A0A1C5AMF7_9ACTN|nr:hypothetical protein [Micromonospora mirobrigensis]SCF46415.1 hypothetical protein GA0070564_11371 [Micromonospora mirobrigensis]